MEMSEGVYLLGRPYVLCLLQTKVIPIRERLDKLLDRLGLLRQPTKGFGAPTQFGHHLGSNIDSATCYFFAPADILQKTSTHASKDTLSDELPKTRVGYRYETYSHSQGRLSIFSLPS
jgi:hypothetical protein